MRLKADHLGSASTDPNAPRIVGLMRRIADAMESGEL